MLRLAAALTLALSLACSRTGPAPEAASVRIYRGATVFDGERNAIPNGAFVVRDGKIADVGPSAVVETPEGAETVDLTGKFVMPGWILGHGHAGGTRGLESGPSVYTRENILDQLLLYANYGVTTVVSLGGDGPPAFEIRDEQATAPPDRARLFVAGDLPTGPTPDDARAQVDAMADRKADWIKIRVDPTMGDNGKLAPDVSQAAIERAHERGLRVAAHIYALADAKRLLEQGVDFLVHSVRDADVDDELISMLKEKNVCLCPTLARELSTFVYEATPDFFADPFFLRGVDARVIEQLQEPARQKAVRENRAQPRNKQNLETASVNLKRLADAGVPIVFGTDTGPPGRFQGYFEHLEMELMAKAGLSPEAILRSAGATAADCLKQDRLGRLKKGAWADFAVFRQDLLVDVRNSKSLESVFVAGTSVPALPGGR